MNYNNYLVENLFNTINAKNEFKKEENDNIKNMKKRRMKYLMYQQNGGQLSIDNFENPEMLEYEKDHRNNPKLYPNYKLWKKRKLSMKKAQAEIDEKVTRNKRRLAQAEHEKSIAKLNQKKLMKG